MSLQIDAFLNKVDKELSCLNALDKASIIKEIEAVIQESVSKGSDENGAIKTLGTPEEVAKIYTAKRGMINQGRSCASKIIKPILLSLATILAVMVIILGFALWKFSPLIKMSDKGISLLGGSIEMNDDGISIGLGNSKTKKVFDSHPDSEKFSYSWNFSKTDDNTESYTTTNGNKLIDLASIKLVKIIFDSGQYAFTSSNSDNLSWDCKIKGNKESEIIASFENNELKINAGNKEIQCEVKIPENLAINVEGKNGTIYLNKPHYNAKIYLTNGTIGIEADKAKEYKYDMQVKNGMTPKFSSSNNEDAYHIDISVDNGMITNK